MSELDQHLNNLDNDLDNNLDNLDNNHNNDTPQNTREELLDETPKPVVESAEAVSQRSEEAFISFCTEILSNVNNTPINHISNETPNTNTNTQQTAQTRNNVRSIRVSSTTV